MCSAKKWENRFTGPLSPENAKLLLSLPILLRKTQVQYERVLKPSLFTLKLKVPIQAQTYTPYSMSPSLKQMTMLELKFQRRRVNENNLHEVE